jgi:putative ABC transport system substrate-binding protein
MLSELIPNASLIALLINPNFPPSAASARDVQAAAREIKRQIILLNASNEIEIEVAFAKIAEARASAAIIDADPFFYSHRDQIAALAMRYAVAAVCEQREFVTAGALMSYGTDITASYRQMGIYVGQILKGIKPADLPVMQLTNFQLVINSKTAKTLALAIPSSVLAITDEVIE